MHPQIRQFPSAQFYQGRLEDAEQSILARELDPSFNFYRPLADVFERVVFFDLCFAKEEKTDLSKTNSYEA
jgi:superfamily I DNA and/or RNA helicase